MTFTVTDLLCVFKMRFFVQLCKS